MGQFCSALTVCMFCTWTQLLSSHGGQAAHHYCDNGKTTRFLMGWNSSAKETLLTNIRNQNRYLASQRCSWELLMRDIAVPQHVFLQARTRPMPDRPAEDTVRKQTVCNITLTVELTGSNFKAVWLSDQEMPKAPFVLPVYNSSQKMIASFSIGRLEPSADCERMELAVSSVVKGYCDRHMLLHRSRCHLVSDAQLLERDFTGTGLSLTGFSGVADVQHLLRDNDLRMDEYPYARPLDVSSPVRVGVFRCPGSERSVYWNSSSCVLEAFNQTGMNITAVSTHTASPQCLSLRVQPSGQPSLQFSDCGEPMRSLLSFTESPRRGGGACEDRPKCPESASSVPTTKPGLPESETFPDEKVPPDSTPQGQQVIIPFEMTVFIAILAALFAVALPLCWWHLRTRSPNPSTTADVTMSASTLVYDSRASTMNRSSTQETRPFFNT